MSRLLYSAIDAFKKDGLLGLSDETIDYAIQPSRSPWLAVGEAEALRCALIPEPRAT